MITKPSPSAAVILIGSELLSGRTQDTNLSYIATGLTDKGIRLAEARIIADSANTIIQTVNELRARHTYVFTTGGIGPTHDDITADCIAEAFGVELPIHDEARSRLMSYFKERKIEPNEDRLRMARIPLGATLIDNPVSVAPGFRMDNVFVFAGVPRIMQSMFDNVLPVLEGGEVVLSLSVICDLGEGTVASPLRELQEHFPQAELGSYPGKVGDGRLTLVARSTSESELEYLQESLEALVLKAGGRVLGI